MRGVERGEAVVLETDGASEVVGEVEECGGIEVGSGAGDAVVQKDGVAHGLWKAPRFQEIAGDNGVVDTPFASF